MGAPSQPPSKEPARGAPRGRLAIVDDPLFDEHRAKGYHPERPERLTAARHAVAMIERAGFPTERLTDRDARPEELARVHDAAYVEALLARAGEPGALDGDTYLAARSVPAAVRAAGASIALVDALLDPAPDAPRAGLALVRPPGHHARPAGGMGFCLLNNVAIAAAHALASGLERVAIVDWDVHHGNGTEEAFYGDPRVLCVSLHQYPFYPGTGGAERVGEGDGTGTNVNIPLSAGAGDAIYQAAFDRIVEPVLEAYAPQLLLVSAGFDAHARDPLAGMVVSAAGFGAMARAIGRAARATAGGRAALFLEGGYDLEGLEASLFASLEGLLGDRGAASTDAVGDLYDPAHALELDRARSFAGQHFRL